MQIITSAECQISAGAILSIARFNERCAVSRERLGQDSRLHRSIARQLRQLAEQKGLPPRGRVRFANDNRRGQQRRAA